ncbi:jg18475 [Pararge aegeria aegeria]|uniref:Jg18475 protein n=1 Tax=Pararge aegeria aegeria TaxID=348720 RepID=A0A8S4RMS5_9NEOP|nr:jg18475 [Pararge aegeria aegeria]
MILHFDFRGSRLSSSLVCSDPFALFEYGITEAEPNGLNCKCADVFIAGPETNERARDGPASLWELIEVAANSAPEPSN